MRRISSRTQIKLPQTILSACPSLAQSAPSSFAFRLRLSWSFWLPPSPDSCCQRESPFSRPPRVDQREPAESRPVLPLRWWHQTELALVCRVNRCPLSRKRFYSPIVVKPALTARLIPGWFLLCRLPSPTLRELPPGSRNRCRFPAPYLF